jgi:hypothetical protein
MRTHYGPWQPCWISNGRGPSNEQISLTLDPMGISHFHLFFWNHKTDLNQTWQKCSLDGHIQDFCFWCWSEIQRSHVEFPISAKNKLLVYDHPMNISTKFGSNLFCGFRKKRWKCEIPIGSNVKLSRVGISHFHLFFWNHKTDLNQTWQKCSLDGHIQDVCFWCWSEIQHDCQGP